MESSHLNISSFFNLLLFISEIYQNWGRYICQSTFTRKQEANDIDFYLGSVWTVFKTVYKNSALVQQQISDPPSIIIDPVD